MSKRDIIYHPSKLFVDQLVGLLDFVTQRKLQLTDVDPVELNAILDAQRAQEEQEKIEESRHKTAELAFARSTASRHSRFQVMLGTVRAHFRGDVDTLTVLEGLKRPQERSEATKAQSKAERESCRAARTEDRLTKAMERVAKLQQLLAEQKVQAAKAVEADSQQPNPKSSPDGK